MKKCATGSSLLGDESPELKKEDMNLVKGEVLVKRKSEGEVVQMIDSSDRKKLLKEEGMGLTKDDNFENEERLHDKFKDQRKNVDQKVHTDRRNTGVE